MESSDDKSKNLQQQRNGEEGIYEEEIKLEWFGARHTLALFGFLATTSSFALRVNLSVAIVAMVNSTGGSNELNNCTCPLPEDSEQEDSGYDSGELEWDETTQGLVLGAFYIGGILTNIPGGRASEYWGGRLVAGVGVILGGIFTLFSPWAARTSTSLFVVTRILIGCATGMVLPALNTLIAKWYPRKERAKFSCTIFAGSTFGILITLLISGWLCESDFLGGWPSVFYFFGTLALVWGVFWFWLIRDDPKEHPHISDAELKYILKGVPQTEERLPVPWIPIFTSGYVWVIALTHFGNNWGFYTLLTELPTYFDRILHINIKKNGMLSAMPYLGEWLFSIAYSLINDRLTARGILSFLSARKLAMAIGSYGPMIGLFMMCFVNCHRVLAFVVLVGSGAFNGAFYSGLMSSHTDISPRYAGTLLGLTNTIATIPGFVSPQITGLLTKDNQTLWAWRFVFIIAALMYGINVTFYIIFITTEVQPWNDPKPDVKTDDVTRPENGNSKSVKKNLKGRSTS